MWELYLLRPNHLRRRPRCGRIGRHVKLRRMESRRYAGKSSIPIRLITVLTNVRHLIGRDVRVSVHVHSCNLIAGVRRGTVKLFVGTHLPILIEVTAGRGTDASVSVECVRGKREGVW